MLGLSEHTRLAFCLALSRRFNRSNTEGLWRLAWHAATGDALYAAGLADHPLVVTSELPVIYRGLTNHQIAPLDSITVFEEQVPTRPVAPLIRDGPEPHSPSEQSSESDSEYDSDEEESGGSQDSAIPIRRERPVTRSDRLDTNLGPSSPPPLLANSPPSPSTSTSSSTAPAVHASQGLPPNITHQLAAAPSIASTEPVRRGSDARRALDLALLICHAAGGIPEEIHGYRVDEVDALSPWLMEVKAVSTRREPIERIPSLRTETHLAKKFLLAYKDFRMKLPHFFAFSSAQRSTIALACVGLWWSFAIVNRDDEVLNWSDAFTIGHAPHDAVLVGLLRGAVHSPSDPANNDTINRLFIEHINRVGRPNPTP